MAKKVDYKKLVETMHKENMMYFVLGSLISADSNMTSNSEAANKGHLEKIIAALEELKQNNTTNVPDEDIGKYYDYAKKSMDVFENNDGEQ